MSYWNIFAFCMLINSALKAEAEVKCEADFGDWLEDTFYPQNGTTIQCSRIGLDGRHLDEVLRRTLYVDRFNRRNYTFDELAFSLNTIQADWSVGNVTITKNGLKNLTNLVFLKLSAEPTHNADTSVERNYLDISLHEFANTPNLNHLWISGYTLTDTSIEALRSLRNKISSLTVSAQHVWPQKKLLKEVAQFANLTEFHGSCSDEPFPVSIIKNSATTLKSIIISNCVIKTITRDLFSGMTKLSYLQWQYSNITSIEEGSFDELLNLKVLDLNHNPFKTLPDGLFNQTKKLWNIVLPWSRTVDRSITPCDN